MQLSQKQLRKKYSYTGPYLLNQKGYLDIEFCMDPIPDIPDPPNGERGQEQYSSQSYAQLKQLCRERDLENKGKKVDLVDRLKKYDAKLETDRKRFKVYIKTMMGSCYTIYIEKTATVLELKQAFYDQQGVVPPQKQRLLLIRYPSFQDVSTNIGDVSYPDGTIGKMTRDTETLDTIGATNESFFNLSIRLG